MRNGITVGELSFNVGELITRLTHNRSVHAIDHARAVDGWEVDVVDGLKDALKRHKSGKRVQYSVPPIPTNHFDDYDVVISMLTFTSTRFSGFIRHHPDHDRSSPHQASFQASPTGSAAQRSRRGTQPSWPSPVEAVARHG